MEYRVKNRKTGVPSVLTEEQYQAYLNNPHLAGSLIILPQPKVPEEVKQLLDSKEEKTPEVKPEASAKPPKK